MKQLYLRHLSVSMKQFILLTVFLIVSFATLRAQVYTARFSGAIEVPPNPSPGTGSATVTVTGTTMRVQANFSGLLGNTTVSHIHAPTAAPGVGTAGVATTTPTFPGFPAGVQSGTYDRTLDMTLASSYNPAFITANGGTTATAFAALYAALNNGTSYFNIHTNLYPGGEIRGFLVLCPTINVSIPNAFALPSGTLPNTVYPAYAPAASLTLSANATGGTGPYTYSWSNGSNLASATVTPTVSTTYTVSVKDQNGCPGSASKTVHVMDIAGGKNGDKITVCHKGSNTLTIGTDGVADHLAHGDFLGGCTVIAKSASPSNLLIEQAATKLSARVLTNPSPNYFTLELSGKASIAMQLKVYDLNGRMIESKQLSQKMQMLRIGNHYQPGMYIVEIVQGKEKQILRLMKSN